MASSLEDFESKFISLGLFEDIPPIVGEAPQTEDSAAALTNEPPEIALKVGVENMIEAPSTANMMDAPSDPDIVQAEQNEADIEALPTLNVKKPNIQKTNLGGAEVVEHTSAQGPKKPWPNVKPMFKDNGLGNNMQLMFIVSMVQSNGDNQDDDELIHIGDFVIEVLPTTTIRVIKYGITATLAIHYEDMRLVYTGKLLSDSRTIAHYKIEEGQIVHLLADKPNKFFTCIYKVFKHFFTEEQAVTFAKNFIFLMGSEDGQDPTQAPNAQQLQKFIEQHMPGGVYSDDSSAEDDDEDDDEDEDDDDYDMPQSQIVETTEVHSGVLKLGFINEEEFENNSDDDIDY